MKTRKILVLVMAVAQVSIVCGAESGQARITTEKKPHDLVNVREYCGDNIVVDLCFYTTRNFMNQKFYRHNEPFLCKEAAIALAKAAELAKKHGYRIFISDAYRPMRVQEKLWETCPDERYVANPKKGGFHTRGIAVDVTLIDADGKQLPMPSEIDDLTEKAHRKDYDKLPENVRANILLLEEIMDQAGFEQFKFEWWHYNLKGWQNYSPLAFSFDDLMPSDKSVPNK